MHAPDRARSLLRMLRENPLRAVSRTAELALARIAFWGHRMGAGVSATGWVKASGGGTLQLEDNISFAGGMLATELVTHQGGSIRFGEGTFCNYGVSIEAHESVTIGKRCLLASFVRLSDLTSTRKGPVVIEDDVWLAHGVIIEPGVTVGAGSVVSAGSVVTENVPTGSLASGNPAKWVRLNPPEVAHEARGGRQWVSR